VHQGFPTTAAGGQVWLPQLRPEARVALAQEDTTFLLDVRDEQQLYEDGILLHSLAADGLADAGVRALLVTGPGAHMGVQAQASNAVAHVPAPGLFPVDQWTMEFAVKSPAMDLTAQANFTGIMYLTQPSLELIVQKATNTSIQFKLTLQPGVTGERTVATLLEGSLTIGAGDFPADTWVRCALVFNNTGPVLRMIRGANTATALATVTNGPWGTGIIRPWTQPLYFGARSQAGGGAGVQVADVRIGRYAKAYGVALEVKRPTAVIAVATTQGAWPEYVAGALYQYTGLGGAGADTHPTVRDIQLDALEDSGCPILRIDEIDRLAPVTDAASTPLGIDYTLLDALWDRFYARGFDFYITLDYCPSALRATPASAYSPATDVTKLARYFSQVVAHIKSRYPGRLKRVTLWNEPSTTGGYWAGTKAEFLTMDLAVATLFATDHPDLPVGPPDQGWLPGTVVSGSGTDYMKSVVDQRQSNALTLGPVQLHDYSEDFDYTARAIADVRAYIDAKGFTTTPIGIGEWGLSLAHSLAATDAFNPTSIEQRNQTAYVAAFAHAFMATMIANGCDMGAVLRIGQIPSGTSEGAIGMFDDTGRPWPLYAAFALMWKHAGTKVAITTDSWPGFRQLASIDTDGRIMLTYSSFRRWKPTAKRRRSFEWTGLPATFTWKHWQMDHDLEHDGRPALVGSGTEDDLPMSVLIGAIGVGGIEIVPS
jgi:hypothetical protein